jgi:hypothetical protein
MAMNAKVLMSRVCLEITVAVTVVMVCMEKTSA